MSRDIFVQDLPRSARTVADIPNDFVPRPLGPSDEIIEKIRRVAPDADFSDIEWGRIKGPTYSIEVNIRRAETVQGFAFHVRGVGADALIAEILRSLDLRALDVASPTGFFESGIHGSVDEGNGSV
jgi:hypothetical protein